MILTAPTDTVCVGTAPLDVAEAEDVTEVEAEELVVWALTRVASSIAAPTVCHNIIIATVIVAKVNLTRLYNDDER
jgi:hypothetical protein